MFIQTLSSTLLGIDSILVRVEVDISGGIPGYHIVGLPDASVSEACDRVRAALRNSGFEHPSRKITINLSPGDVRKEGPRFDLAMALGVLAAGNELDQAELEGVLLLGELSLDGELRPVRGVTSAAVLARREGIERILVPVANAHEAALVEGLQVSAALDLKHAREILRGKAPSAPWMPAPPVARPDVPDLAMVKGQQLARRALEVSAAGGHHLLFLGPPGAGKTLLASCLPGILPELTPEQRLEVNRIHSVRGEEGLPEGPPFRYPEPGVTRAALLGSVLPGEVTLAHHGVLFLDEFPELRRDCLEGLRTPLELGRISVARARFRVTYPARFTLIAAMNPCPCGYLGDPGRVCRCPPLSRWRYQGRVSGPLKDRIDLQVQLPRLAARELVSAPRGESSAEVRSRVSEARLRQERRGFLNARIPAQRLRKACGLGDSSLLFLERSAQKMGMSARVYDRLLRVGRTLADLRGAERVSDEDLAEALEYRFLDSHPAVG